jgi:hypothetical protein
MNSRSQTDSEGTPDAQVRRSIVRRLADALFGYDFFISYARADGHSYAVALARGLEAKGFDVFLDTEDYLPGDDWKRIGAWALKRTNRLVLICTPKALESMPVRRELEIYTRADKRVIPIDIGGCLTRLAPEHPVAGLLEGSVLRLPEGEERRDIGPTDAVISELNRAFKGERQMAKRSRWIRWTIVVLLILSATLAGTTWWAFRQKEEAFRQTEEANRQKKAANREKEAAQTALAQTFVRTIGQGDLGNAPTRIEVDSLWELAQLGPEMEPVRAMVLNAWFGRDGDPVPAVARDQAGLLAAMGLRPDRCKREAMTAALVNVMANPGETDFVGLLSLAPAFNGLAGKLDAQAAVALADRAIKAMENPQEADAFPLDRLYSLAAAFDGLAGKLDTKAAADLAERGAECLIKATKVPQESPTVGLIELGEAFHRLAEKIDATAAANLAQRGADHLMTALEDPQKFGTFQFASLTSTLIGFAEKLDAKAAAALAKRLMDAMGNLPITELERLCSIAAAFNRVAEKLDTKAAADLAQPGLKRVVEALKNTPETEAEKRSKLAEAFNHLAKKLDAKVTAAWAEPVMTAIMKTQEADPSYFVSLAETFNGLAGKLDAKTADAWSGTLMEAIKKTPATEPETLADLARALDGFAEKLDAKAAAALAKRLITALKSPPATGGVHLIILAKAFNGLAGKLDAKAAGDMAQQGAKGLITAFERTPTTDGVHLIILAKAFNGLAGKLDTKAAADLPQRAAKRLIEALEKTPETDPENLASLAEAFNELAGRLDSKAAADSAHQEAKRLIAALESTPATDPENLASLAEAFNELAGKLDAKAAAALAEHGAERLSKALGDPEYIASRIPAFNEVTESHGALGPRALARSETRNLSRLAEAFNRMAGKLDAKVAADLGRQGAEGLFKGIEKTQVIRSFDSSSQETALLAILPRIAERSAEPLAAHTVLILANPKNGSQPSEMSDVANRISPFLIYIPHVHREIRFWVLSSLLVEPWPRVARINAHIMGLEAQGDFRRVLREICLQLSKVELVEVLKWPLCRGESQKLVLSILEDKTDAKFDGDVWKFVEMAPSLGITNLQDPPRRPSLKKAIEELESSIGQQKNNTDQNR